MCLAVALDHLGALGDLAGEVVIGRGILPDQTEPSVDALLLEAKAQGAPPDGAHARHRVEHRVTPHRRRVELESLVRGLVDQRVGRLGTQHPSPQRRGKGVRDLLDLRVQVLAHLHQLLIGDTGFVTDALEALLASLEEGHANGVLVRHPQGGVARGLGGQARGGIGIESGDGCHAIEELIRVGDVLVLGRALEAHDEVEACRSAEVVGDPCSLRGETGADHGGRISGGQGDVGSRGTHGNGIQIVVGAGADGELDGRALRRCCDGEALVERAQARLNALAARANGVLELLAGERQNLGTGDGAEEHGTDDTSRVVRNAREVAAHETLGRRTDSLEDPSGVHPTLTHGRALGHGVGATGRRDHGGAVGGDETARDGSPGLHELGCDHDVDLTGRGHGAQHRIRGGRGPWEEFQVVDRGTGALRDAGDRGALAVPAVVLGDVDQPVGQYAAAFATHGEDRHGDRARASGGVGRHQRGHAGSIPVRRRSMPRCSQPM